jgi:hypothetical protein
MRRTVVRKQGCAAMQGAELIDCSSLTIHMGHTICPWFATEMSVVEIFLEALYDLRYR